MMEPPHGEQPRPGTLGFRGQEAGQSRPAQIGLDRLLRRAAAGDAQAWRALVERYSGRVFGLLVRQCKDRELAEELTQATFVKVVTKLVDYAGYEERGRFEPWLFRIAMNRLRDEMRRRKRQALSMDMSPGAASGSEDQASGWAAAEAHVIGRQAQERADPVEAASQAEEIEKVHAAIIRLNETDQRVLHLRHTAGLSFAQIAETLNEPLGTVLARGHRALGKLRKLLAEPEPGTGPSRPSIST